MLQDILELPRLESNSIVSSLLDLGNDPLEFLTRCAHEYRDILPMHLGLTPTCLITNPK